MKKFNGDWGLGTWCHTLLSACRQSPAHNNPAWRTPVWKAT